MPSPPAVFVTPADTLLPEPVTIRAVGFEPGAWVRLSSHLVDELGVEWSAHGRFVADHRGEVDTATAPSENGTYTGTDAAGLLWSMLPPTGLDRRFQIDAQHPMHAVGRPALDPLQPLLIEIQANSPHTGQHASARLTLRRVAAEVEMVNVRDGRLRGLAFCQVDRSRSRGAIMSLTGSGGGVESSFAPLLASLGYDVFSLAYFAYEDLPKSIYRIPFEYFLEGFAWMRREFGCQRIAVQGGSRGGELTLALAAYFPGEVAGALAFVPMHASTAAWDPEGRGVAGPSWTFQGGDVPFAESKHVPSLDAMRAASESQPFGYAVTPDYRADLDTPEVRERCTFAIERARCPILLVSGADDQMWPSSWASDVVVNRLRAANYAHPYRHLSLPGTGHWTALPNTITSFTQAIYHSLGKVFLACGGTPPDAARASRAMWDAVVEHYERTFPTTSR